MVKAMHATTDRDAPGHRRDTPPLLSCTVQMELSFDSGSTWTSCGVLRVPTTEHERSARLLLMTCMTMTGDGSTLWRVSAWPTAMPVGPPAVVLRSDGNNP
jgi:hypothetical protein